MLGFGHSAFGAEGDTFGHANWGRAVLWEELPSEVKQQDLDAGGWYYKFATSLVPSFNELKTLVEKSQQKLLDPRTARADLLEWLAMQFGIIPDLAEPESSQRLKIEMVGRWRLIKGTEEAYKVLCAIHGFNVEVKELWWDGENLTEYPSSVSNEVIGVIE